MPYPGASDGPPIDDLATDEEAVVEGEEAKSTELVDADPAAFEDPLDVAQPTETEIEESVDALGSVATEVHPSEDTSAVVSTEDGETHATEPLSDAPPQGHGLNRDPFGTAGC